MSRSVMTGFAVNTSELTVSQSVMTGFAVNTSELTTSRSVMTGFVQSATARRERGTAIGWQWRRGRRGMVPRRGWRRGGFLSVVRRRACYQAEL